MHSLYFTKDKPIVFNFHGYRTTIKKLLFDYDVSDRIIIHGYDERGSTTSPFDMLARNGLSRYQLVQDLARQGERAGVISQEDRVHVVSEMQKKMKEEKEYIIKFGIDPPELHSW
jgi:xylulose-5-phosphate/fructose-6-phosphate phosphoketolase